MCGENFRSLFGVAKQGKALKTDEIGNYVLRQRTVDTPKAFDILARRSTPGTTELAIHRTLNGFDKRIHFDNYPYTLSGLIHQATLNPGVPTPG